jgi:hypothetical protein
MTTPAPASADHVSRRRRLAARNQTNNTTTGWGGLGVPRSSVPQPVQEAHGTFHQVGSACGKCGDCWIRGSHNCGCKEGGPLSLNGVSGHFPNFSGVTDIFPNYKTFCNIQIIHRYRSFFRTACSYGPLTNYTALQYVFPKLRDFFRNTRRCSCHYRSFFRTVRRFRSSSCLHSVRGGGLNITALLVVFHTPRRYNLIQTLCQLTRPFFLCRYLQNCITQVSRWSVGLMTSESGIRCFIRF